MPREGDIPRVFIHRTKRGRNWSVRAGIPDHAFVGFDRTWSVPRPDGDLAWGYSAGHEPPSLLDPLLRIDSFARVWAKIHPRHVERWRDHYRKEGSPMANKSLKDETEKWVKDLKRAGYTVEADSGNFKVRDPNTGGLLTHFSATPKDIHSVKNAKQRARRVGIEWEIEPEKNAANGASPPPVSSDLPERGEAHDRRVDHVRGLIKEGVEVAGTQAEFVRYAMQLDLPDNLTRPGSFNAAQVAVSQFVGGKTGMSNRSMDFWEYVVRSLNESTREQEEAKRAEREEAARNATAEELREQLALRDQEIEALRREQAEGDNYATVIAELRAQLVSARNELGEQVEHAVRLRARVTELESAPAAAPAPANGPLYVRVLAGLLRDGTDDPAVVAEAFTTARTIYEAGITA